MYNTYGQLIQSLEKILVKLFLEISWWNSLKADNLLNKFQICNFLADVFLFDHFLHIISNLLPDFDIIIRTQIFGENFDGHLLYWICCLLVLNNLIQIFDRLLFFLSQNKIELFFIICKI